MREQENQGSENCAAYPSADTSSDTLMGGLHTVGHYLDPYQPTRALTRRILSPPSASWVKRGESVSRPLPRVLERTTKKRRLPIYASQQLLRDRPRVSSAAMIRG